MPPGGIITHMGRLLARTVIGGIFLGHGTQKLLGWFDGPGLDGTEKTMGKLELHPARRNALAASLSETVGGALVLLGAFTPAAGAMLTGTMVTAIRTVHFKNGPWNGNGGYEFNLALIAGVTALVDAGPGPISIDRGLGIEAKGSKWALAALAAGAAGSALTIEAGRRAKPEPSESAPAPSDTAATPEPAAAPA